MKELSISPVTTRYGMHQEDQLVKQLEDLDRHSSMIEVAAPQDVLLDPKGRVSYGSLKFRYTHLALSQLCNHLGGNIFGFIRELSGAHRTIDEERSDYSFDEALNLLNKIINLRFTTRLAGKKLLRNVSTLTIDGIMGGHYQWLPNIRMYELTKAAATDHHLGPEFYESVLYGRWLLMRYACHKPYFSFPVIGRDAPDRFYAGFHFSNDEVGQASIRGAAMLLRQKGRTSSITEFKPTERIKHLGDTLEAKVTAMIGDAFKRLEEPEVYAEKLQKLSNVSLGLNHKDVKADLKVRDNIVRRLLRKEMPKDLARKFVDSAMGQGSYDDHKVDALDNPGDRTVYDLYNSIGREARSLSVRHREAAEQIAYSLMMGNLSL
jgi:hypothetical protein